MDGTNTRFAEETRAERERLASIFDAFGPEQWDADSLCEGWSAKEVLAHMTMPYRLSALRFLGGMLRARFRFDRFADRDARAVARARNGRELTELYQANVDHPWRPPGGGPAGALSHEVVHGLDITEPLGLPAPPPERIALAFAATGPRNLKYFGVDLTGARLVAEDAELTVGKGEPHHMLAKDVLLVATGRLLLADVGRGSGRHEERT